MTEPADKLSDLDPVMREAIAWVARLRSGEATTADAEALNEWRKLGAHHEAAFRQAALLWRNFAAVGAGTDGELDHIGRNRQISRRIFIGGSLATAAGVAGLMAVQPPFGLWPSLQEFSANYRTGKGEQRQVTFGPAISFKLNTLTSIADKSTPDQQRIELISGEALIDARLSKQKPLIVIAGNGRVLASRAKFNARCINGVTSIACLDGAVEIEQHAHAVRLEAGQELAYSAEKFGAQDKVDLAEVTSWETGLLIFHDRPLTAVVDEINRYRAGRIIVLNPELGQRIIDATFHVDHLDNFLVQAQQLFGAKVTNLPGGIALLG